VWTSSYSGFWLLASGIFVHFLLQIFSHIRYLKDYPPVLSHEDFAAVSAVTWGVAKGGQNWSVPMSSWMRVAAIVGVSSALLATGVGATTLPKHTHAASTTTHKHHSLHTHHHKATGLHTTTHKSHTTLHTTNHKTHTLATTGHKTHTTLSTSKHKATSTTGWRHHPKMV
jgi:hypothetical protein